MDNRASNVDVTFTDFKNYYFLVIIAQLLLRGNTGTPHAKEETTAWHHSP
jgi:hypothetical protein